MPDTPADLANKIAGSGITPYAVRFNQAGTTDDESIAAGKFSGGQPYVRMASGVVLSSGDVSTLPGSNETTSSEAFLGTGSDADLETLVDPSLTVNDATVLEFKFMAGATANTISVEYVFLSEEYNEFVNSAYNDVFGFFVNGVNYATVGSAQDPVTINSVNLGSNSLLYIDNDVNGTSPPPTSISIEADGLTTVLTCTAPIIPSQENTIKFAIGDVSDDRLDSWVMIKEDSLTTARPVISGVHAANSVSQPGSTNTYTVKFTNQESTAVDLSEARVEIPTGFSYRSGTTTGDVTANPSISGKVLTWAFPSPNELEIPANSTVSWTFDVNVASVSGIFFASADGQASVPVLESGDTASVSIGIAQPIGYVRLGDTNPSNASVPANTEMAVGFPFEQPVEFIGNVSSVNGTTITLKDSPGFTTNRWTGTEPRVLQVESGSSNGLNALISANGGDTVTVVLSPGDDLSGLADGDIVTIRKAQTLMNQLPIKSGVKDGHQLFGFSGTIAGMNLSADMVYEFYAGVWYDLNDSSVADNYVLHRSEGFVYRNDTSVTANHLLARGVVPLANQRTQLEKISAGVGQDVRFSLTSALPVDLEDSGLGFSVGDMVFTFNKGTGINKSADQIHEYLGSGQWEDLTTGNPSVLALQPGDSYILRRPSSAPAGYALWSRSQAYASSLPPVAIDPLAVAHPQLIPLPPAFSSQEFRFKFFAESGVTYKVQVSSDLVNWSTIETLTGAGVEVGRSDFSVQPVRKFYRVERQ